MIYIVILFSSLFLGGIVGRFLKKKDKTIKGLNAIQVCVLFFLIFFMGTRIGSDERIVESIQTIGVSAVVITIATMFGSVLAVFLFRKCLRLNKKGEKLND